MIEKHPRKCSTSLIKTNLRFHLTAVKWPRTKIQGIANAGEDVEKEEHSSIAGEIASC